MIFINAVAVVLYVYSCWRLLQRPQHRTLLFFIFSMQAWSAVSCFYNDLAIYNIELFGWTNTTLATTKLCLFYLIFNAGMATLFWLLRNSELPKTAYESPSWLRQTFPLPTVVYGISACVVTLLAYSFIANGVPLLMGIHKRAFLEDAGTFERLIATYGFVLTFALGLARCQNRRLSDLFLTCLLIGQICTGNKFSSLYMLVICYLLPVAAHRYTGNHNFGIRFRTVVRFVGLGVAVVGLTFSSYLYWSNDKGTASFLFLDRVLANQGHLWWAVDNDVSSYGRYDQDHWQREVASVFLPSSVGEAETGMKYLMLNVLGPDKAWPIFDSGYLYTMAWPAILIVSFPYGFGLVIQFVIGMLMASLLFYLNHTLRHHFTLRAVLVLTIIVPCIVMTFTGSFATLLTLGLIIKLLLLLSLECGLLGSPKTVPAT